MLPIDIQHFAEPSPPGDPAPTEPQQIFTAEYVSALRSESAGYRTRARAAETALRTLFGLKETDELGDIPQRTAAYQRAQNEQQQAALAAADRRLIGAALHGLEGYDTKLLEKLIDLSKVKVTEDGTVEGLQEAAEQAAREYPACKLRPAPFARSAGGAQPKETDKEKANAALRALFGRSGT